MTEEEIAKDIYIHHFDDDVNYPDVLKAITVGVQKGAEFGKRQSGKKIEELKMTDEYIIKTLESKVEKLQEDLRNKRISIKNKKAEIKELEEKISVLLSCKKCPENKGGYICKEEYDNKCLAQKIQYIKELQEENAELKVEIENDRDLPTVAYMQGAEKQKKKDAKQLTKATEIIKRLKCLIEDVCDINYLSKNNTKLLEQAKQFLKEIEK